jgi:ankyrin repeat protein
MLQCQLDSLTNLLVTHKHLVATTYGQGLTPLMYAARGSLLGCVERLLEHGADVNAVDRQGCSALYMAAELGREAVARLLLAHQADLTTPTRNGSTVLMGATVTCGPALVSHILARVDTAHVNKCNRYGDSALALACHYGKMTEAKLLLWAGADPAAGPGGGPRKIAMMGHGINPRAVLELFQVRLVLLWKRGEKGRL